MGDTEGQQMGTEMGTDMWHCSALTAGTDGHWQVALLGPH
ncbi:unnamed protein product [Staurois parvus]|uniref:Uncharacterized protein n=1 Tax=Staurois parvus TaxID=386267 RepID=A0ABN9H2S6_9NEOB|nr:unnamed protein product [Staurois parvus]